MVKKKSKGNFLTRDISKFLRDEKGRMSKHSVMMMGALVGTAAATALISPELVKAGTVSIVKSGSGQQWTVTASVTHGY